VPSVQPVFYYDLGDPDCYLVAEQVVSALAVVPEFEPVHGRALGLLTAEPDREGIAAQAQELDLQPLRWPSVWPPDSETAMLAATYAKHVGRGVSFSLAAFRQAFAGGRDLGDDATVLIAAAACEMHPTAVLKGVRLRSVTTALAKAGDRALAVGARRLPAIGVGDELFDSPDCIELADAALGARR
jgi:2-hydroxychromene-2-carboxylate isomerase